MIHRPISECSWCGRLAACSGAGTGEAICHSCYHYATDWHRSCDIGDDPTECPFCGAILATHDHGHGTDDYSLGMSAE